MAKAKAKTGKTTQEAKAKTTREAIRDLWADFRAQRDALKEKHCQMKDGKPVPEDESICAGWKFKSEGDEATYKESFKALEATTKAKLEELDAMQKVGADPPVLDEEERAKGFEVGKCYRHAAGEEIHVLGITETDIVGTCMFAESNRDIHGLKMLGMNADARENWSEISMETWKQNFEA